MTYCRLLLIPTLIAALAGCNSNVPEAAKNSDLPAGDTLKLADSSAAPKTRKFLS